MISAEDFYVVRVVGTGRYATVASFDEAVSVVNARVRDDDYWVVEALARGAGDEHARVEVAYGRGRTATRRRGR